jgi:Spy/CpxP family protein refolding chaperone
MNKTTKTAALTVLGLWLGIGAPGLRSAPAFAEPPGPPDVMAPAPPPPGPPGEAVFFARTGPGGPPMMMMGEGPGPMLPLILHQAKLTKEQHDKVRRILDADRESLRNLFGELDEANRDLSNKLFSPGEVRYGDVMPQIERTSTLRRELMEQGVKTTLAIRAVLTPEQLARVTEVKKRLDTLQSEMRQLMEGR